MSTLGEVVDDVPRPAIYVGPDAQSAISSAVVAGGAQVVTDPAAATGFIWTGKNVESLLALLHDGVDWVQLPDAGVERWVAAGILNGRWTVTSARGYFGPQVAEHAVALLLAGSRRLHVEARARSWPENQEWGMTLRGRDVVILGGGDVGRHLVQLLIPFGAGTTVITRRGLPVRGATRTLPVDRLHEGLLNVAALVVAAPATPETRHLIGERELACLTHGAVLVNVARGSLVDPVALLAALDSGQLSAAALDVTEPEPLPAGHPLWEHPHVLITPHVANPPQAKEHGLAALVRENTMRFVNRHELLAVVDPTRGY